MLDCDYGNTYAHRLSWLINNYEIKHLHFYYLSSIMKQTQERQKDTKIARRSRIFFIFLHVYRVSTISY